MATYPGWLATFAISTDAWQGSRDRMKRSGPLSPAAFVDYPNDKMRQKRYTEQIQVTLPKSYVDELRLQARHRNISLSAVMRDVVDSIVARERQ